MVYKRFGWDDEVADQFNGLELNRPFKRGAEPHPMDNLNVATAMTAAGTYDWKRDGRPPMVPEQLFMAVEQFQADQGLKVDGVMNPGGPTQTRLNEVLPARMERPFIRSPRYAPLPQDRAQDKQGPVVREQAIDPPGEGYEPSPGPSLNRPANPFHFIANEQPQLAQARRRAPTVPVQDPNSPHRTIHGQLDRSYGIRNNNPLNVTRGPARDPWLGQEGTNRIPSFDTPENGIRAATLNIWTRYFRDNLRTVRQLVDGWANTSPEHERVRYRQALVGVLSAYGIDSEDAPIPERLLSNHDFMVSLTMAMAAQENHRLPPDPLLTGRAFRRGVTAAIQYELARPQPRISPWPHRDP